MTSKIIRLSDIRKEKNQKPIEKKDLNYFLERACSLRDEKPTEKTLIVSDKQEMSKIFEVGLNKVLLKKKLIDSQFFICALHIASLLAESGLCAPDSLYAIDYIKKSDETGNHNFLMKGADTCFLLISLYPERCDRRTMKISDYISIGSGLYYQFYLRTGEEVGYYMSKNLEALSEITNECISIL